MACPSRRPDKPSEIPSGMSEPPPGSKRRRPSVREPPERLPWLRYDRIARSVTERLRVRPVPGQPFWVLAVRNPVHHTRYQVLLPEHPSGESRFCSCEDFARRGIGTCKHVEAATAWLGTHPEIPHRPAPPPRASSLWRTILAARKASETSKLALPLRWRLAGKALFEPDAVARRRVVKKSEGGKGSAKPRGESRA